LPPCGEAYEARQELGSLEEVEEGTQIGSNDRDHKKLRRVDELFDDNPCGHEMNEWQKGLAQFLISHGNASKLFEVIKEPFDLLP
jgi:hypothetical protein